MIQHAESLLLLVLALATFVPIGYFIYKSVFVHRSIFDGREKHRLSRSSQLPSPRQVRRAWGNVRQRHAENSGGPAFLTVEEFFVGNTDPASIAPNLLGSRHAPSLKLIRNTLEEVSRHPDVSDVRIMVDPQGDDSQWPFSDTVLVFTTLTNIEVAPLVKRLKPTEVAAHPDAPSDHPAVHLWWD